MNREYRYEIRIEGALSERWSDWFDGLCVTAEGGGVTSLTGSLPDQAALFGVLGTIHRLNLTLISVIRQDVANAGDSRRTRSGS